MTDWVRTAYLTKSELLAYRTCPAWAWSLRHRPDAVPPDPEHVVRREDDERRVERVARQMFPGGVPIDSDDPVEATRATERAIAAGARTIFAASVLSPSGLHARADVLTRHPSGSGWRLVDIKASTSTDVETRLDVTFQRLAFSEAGYDLRAVDVMHLDKHYRRNGRLDPNRLFRVDDTVMAWGDAHRPEIEAGIAGALAVLGNPAACPPCDCHQTTRGRRCPTFDHFHPGFAAGDTVYDLVSINQQRLAEALDRGVRRLADWPADLQLSARQRWQVEAARTGRERVKRERLRAFIDAVRYPCYFLDYETFQTPVPLFAGTWPWQQVPFQYSLHVLHEDGAIEHREFLWTDAGEPPIQPLAGALRRDIGDEGSVLVWWKGFEGGRTLELAEAVPELAGFLHGLNARMVDLMEPVSRGLWVHPAFGGSTSLKKVLPVVAPELAYDGLDIGHGAVATLRWKQCVVDAAPPAGVDPDEAFDHLRAYCRRDTLGMVRIWQHLRGLACAGTPDLALAGATP